MSTESDLKIKIKGNDYAFDIIEADELIAVWRYRQANQFKRSVDFSRVPQEWRYSAPPAGNHEYDGPHPLDGFLMGLSSEPIRLFLPL